MQLFQDFDAVSSWLPQSGSSIAIGNFDGCHRGHQFLLKRAMEKGDHFSCEAITVTFDPHPDIFFGHATPHSLMFNRNQKLRAFAEMGLKAAVIHPFDKAFASTTHLEFYEKVLKKSMRARAVVVGQNFRFGFKRLGDAAFLTDQGTADGMDVTVGNHICAGQDVISSTTVRKLIVDGNVKKATELLGRPFLYESVSERGNQLGRTIGIPTINLKTQEQITPGSGVYFGYASIGKPDRTLLQQDPNALPAVINIGVRPTVDQKSTKVKIEAHILDWQGPTELYDENIGLYFSERIRDEQKFDSIDKLVAQIKADIDFARGLV